LKIDIRNIEDESVIVNSARQSFWKMCYCERSAAIP